jgi:hypothetical protein
MSPTAAHEPFELALVALEGLAIAARLGPAMLAEIPRHFGLAAIDLAAQAGDFEVVSARLEVLLRPAVVLIGERDRRDGEREHGCEGCDYGANHGDNLLHRRECRLDHRWSNARASRIRPRIRVALQPRIRPFTNGA